MDRPNQLRLLLAERRSPPVLLQTLVQQQAQIDAEDLAFLQEALREAGALEVFAQPVLEERMPAACHGLAWPEQAEALRASGGASAAAWGYGRPATALGSAPSDRGHQTLGPGALQKATRPDGSVRRKPEFEDLVRLAEEKQLLDQLRQALLQWLEEQR